MIEAVAIRSSELKVAIGHFFGVTPDALHVLVSVALFVGLRGVLPGPSKRLAWPVLLLIECCNELLDLLRPAGPDSGWAASLHDVVLTMLLPSLLVLAWRRWPEGGAAPRETYPRDGAMAPVRSGPNSPTTSRAGAMSRSEDMR